MVGLTKAGLTLGSWAYLTFLAVWLVAYIATGDRYRLMALLNAGALYLFVPLPVVAITAILTWRRELLVGTVLGAAAFVWLWGPLFTPRVGTSPMATQTLTLLTYNTLGPYAQSGPVLDVIRAENADVVLLQEVNPQVGMALRDQLSESYPYQVRRASSGVSGAATISKYPLQETGEQMPRLQWVGAPLVMNLDWDGGTVALVNFHMNIPAFEARSHGTREPQARALVEFAGRQGPHGPVVVAGDTNVTDVSDTYKILTGAYRDAWREAGFGFGHTWGANGIPSHLRPFVPTWFVRIDYVFHTPDLRTVAVRTARHDGISDHRGVVATLVRAR